ncbi:uncharacterized protein LOC142490866 [Ascaphus truei]|uniref:uncharacterized protein LOC142490866 n=1 Tax=Ascaphus truei TaxID=8439 RepID=UPI003F59A030
MFLKKVINLLDNISAETTILPDADNIGQGKRNATSNNTAASEKSCGSTTCKTSHQETGKRSRSETTILPDADNIGHRKRFTTSNNTATSQKSCAETTILPDADNIGQRKRNTTSNNTAASEKSCVETTILPDADNIGQRKEGEKEQDRERSSIKDSYLESMFLKKVINLLDNISAETTILPDADNTGQRRRNTTSNNTAASEKSCGSTTCKTSRQETGKRSRSETTILPDADDIGQRKESSVTSPKFSSVQQTPSNVRVTFSEEQHYSLKKKAEKEQDRERSSIKDSYLESLILKKVINLLDNISAKTTILPDADDTGQRRRNTTSNNTAASEKSCGSTTCKTSHQETGKRSRSETTILSDADDIGQRKESSVTSPKFSSVQQTPSNVRVTFSEEQHYSLKKKAEKEQDRERSSIRDSYLESLLLKKVINLLDNISAKTTILPDADDIGQGKGSTTFKTSHRATGKRSRSETPILPDADNIGQRKESSVTSPKFISVQQTPSNVLVTFSEEQHYSLKKKGEKEQDRERSSNKDSYLESLLLKKVINLLDNISAKTTILPDADTTGQGKCNTTSNNTAASEKSCGNTTCTTSRQETGKKSRDSYLESLFLKKLINLLDNITDADNIGQGKRNTTSNNTAASEKSCGNTTCETSDQETGKMSRSAGRRIATEIEPPSHSENPSKKPSQAPATTTPDIAREIQRLKLEDQIKSEYEPLYVNQRGYFWKYLLLFLMSIILVAAIISLLCFGFRGPSLK